MPCSSTARSYASSQIRYSSGDGDHVLVRGDLEHAVGRRVDDGRPRAHVLRAQLLDDLACPTRPRCRSSAGRCSASKSLDQLAAESRAETSGTARSSTMPVISQWPVTESLPGERSAMRPNAAAGSAGGRDAAERRDAPEPQRLQGGHVHSRPAGRCCRACRCPRRRTRPRRAARRCRRCRARARSHGRRSEGSRRWRGARQPCEDR